MKIYVSTLVFVFIFRPETNRLTDVLIDPKESNRANAVDN